MYVLETITDTLNLKTYYCLALSLATLPLLNLVFSSPNYKITQVTIRGVEHRYMYLKFGIKNTKKYIIPLFMTFNE